MLVAAYSDDVSQLTGLSRFQSARFITQAETEFRKFAFSYGQVLTLPEEQAINVISSQLAVLVGSYRIPPAAEPIIGLALQAAVGICASDYQDALDYTVTHVRIALNSHNIRY